MKKNTRGFTVIELVLVVAIISIIASIVIVSMKNARTKGRNAKRKSDLKQLEVALNYYYDAQTATKTTKGYPKTFNPGGTVVWNSSAAGDANAGIKGGDYIPGLAPSYIDVLPTDPGGDSTCASPYKAAYWYASDGLRYKILSNCAPEGGVNTSNQFYDPFHPGAYMVCVGAIGCAW